MGFVAMPFPGSTIGELWVQRCPGRGKVGRERLYAATCSGSRVAVTSLLYFFFVGEDLPEPWLDVPDEGGLTNTLTMMVKVIHGRKLSRICQALDDVE